MKTREVRIGNRTIGNGNPVLIQSMTNTDTKDIERTIAQILSLERAGCDIVRFTVYDMDCAKAVETIRRSVHIPIVADIHFDYRLAIAAIENGIDKIRFNPGNIGGREKVEELVSCARAHHIPIRIGVNAGSLEKDLKEQYGAHSPKAMTESALRHVRILEKAGFEDIVLSLKASTVRDTVDAYRMISGIVDYPLHVGVTETGEPESGIIKSAAGIGALLLDGIGDTIRVSLTDDPVREVTVAQKLLAALGLRKDDVDIVSCPTCGRTRVNLFEAVRYVNERLLHQKGYLKVAVMGCAVNGPGEAADADIGICFGKDNGVIFKKGVKYKSGQVPGIIDEMISEANRMIEGTD
ncbi:MAG: flavodoxin-dependent (E)-4-hydroxy-3-methylbut-2-enyl-diphosphate synthase [Clostridia bacterium]|nr:flavodoxin-dependent (E)-4-hydroxy-3-methylbut-2-enyl-diphosphate synthase [Clostridia bacterium]